MTNLFTEAVGTATKRPDLTLARVHMRSVGPDAARFDPLDLNHDAVSGVADKVLWSLTNTGGKTTMIRLLSSIVVTASREQVGGSNIGEYVQNGDTSHVVTEWEHRDIGRFVLGAVYEWPDRTRPSDLKMGDLKRNWYTFRVGGVTVDDLPFDVIADDGTRRRRTLADFRDQMTQMFVHRGADQFVWARTAKEWADALDTRTPLDPELFVHQMRMNDEESGAGALIKRLATPDSVVLFFIQALNDDQALANFASTLGGYADLAGQRGALQTDLGFFTALNDGLVALNTVERQRAEAAAAVTATEMAGDDLAARIRVRRTAQQIRLDAATQRYETLGSELDQVQTDEGRQENLRAQLNLEDARLVERDALARTEEAETTVGRTDTELQAWRAVEPIQAWRSANMAATAAREAYDAAEQGLAPLRTDAHTAASHVAAKYAELAAVGEEQYRSDTHASEGAGREAERFDKDRKRFDGEHTRLAGELTQIDREIAASRTGQRELLDAGIALVGEEPAATETRLQNTVIDARADVRGLGDRIGAIGGELEKLVQPVAAARRSVTADEGVARDAAGRLARFLSELEEVANDETVVALAGDSQLTGATEAARISSIATDQAARLEQEAAQFDEQLRVIQAQIARLEAGDLMATAPEIEATRELLRQHGIGATTGWEWIAQNIPAPDRETAIQARPDLANAVIVSDHSRLREAEALCRTEEPDGRIAVLVIDPSAFHASTGTPEESFVLAPHRALFDPEWAEQTLHALRIEQAEWVEIAEGCRVGASRLRGAVAALTSFASRWVNVTSDELNTAVKTAEQAQAATIATLEGLEGQQQALQSEREQANEERNTRSGRLTGLEVALQRATHVAGLQREARRAEDRRAAVISDRTRAERARDAAELARQEADGRRMNLIGRAATARAEAQTYRTRQRDIGIEPASVAPPTALPELESRWRELSSRLRAEEQGSDHAERLRETDRLASELRVAVDELDDDIRTQADALCETFAASNPGLRAESARLAMDAYRSAVAAHEAAKSVLADARRRVTERTPEGRPSHIVLPDDWDVSTSDLIAEQRIEVEASLQTLRDRGRELTETRRQLAAATDLQRTEQQRFDVALRSWRSSADESLDRAYDEYEGSGTQAIDDLGALDQRLREDQLRLTARETTLRDTLDVVRNVARDERWASVASPIRERCKVAPVEEVAASAERWSQDAVIRCRSLSDDLASLDQHRDLLVNQLETLCGNQRRLLNEVTTCSKLPAGVGGDLAGQPAFKINFDKLPDAEARVRLTIRVDDWAQRLAGEGGARSLNRDQRVRWLADAVKDTVKHSQTGAWRVRVLKPPVDGRVEYRAPDRVGTEYSGGQELTLAVLLYCTLAAVRAKHRTGGSRPPGVLLIDNPFGRASNAALIRMQQMLALQSGVQLVCATGLDDPGILAAFEGDTGKVIRLRNDRDQRKGLQYLRIVEPTALQAVTAAFGGARTDTSDEARVSASGYTIRSGRGER